MKSFTLTSTLTLLLVALFGLASAAPIPAPAPADDSASLVMLKLGDGSVARCTLPSGATREKADQVSSRLVASGKVACKDGQDRAPGGGKTLHCDQGQLVSNQEATDTLKDACSDHQGLHQLFMAP
ncbi:hypothetical protein NDA16_003878 [Ustilago loliicola]|nr:hypothetical protein NDA16_003878 [Ustilago loliicola]